MVGTSTPQSSPVYSSDPVVRPKTRNAPLTLKKAPSRPQEATGHVGGLSVTSDEENFTAYKLHELPPSTARWFSVPPGGYRQELHNSLHQGLQLQQAIRPPKRLPLQYQVSRSPAYVAYTQPIIQASGPALLRPLLPTQQNHRLNPAPLEPVHTFQSRFREYTLHACLTAVPAVFLSHQCSARFFYPTSATVVTTSSSFTGVMTPCIIPACCYCSK